MRNLWAVLAFGLLAAGIVVFGVAVAGRSRDSSEPKLPGSTVTNTATSVGGDPLSTVPPCSSLDGKILTDAASKSGCRVDRTLYPFGGPTCSDGRQLVWNDVGWGYVGGVYTKHIAGAEKVAPASERTACG